MMNDTTPEVQEMIDNFYTNKSGEEKLLIAFSMFETAREIVISSFPKNMTRSELLRDLFLRFYGNDFSEEEKKNILKNLCH